MGQWLGVCSSLERVFQEKRHLAQDLKDEKPPYKDEHFAYRVQQYNGTEICPTWGTVKSEASKEKGAGNQGER